MVVPFGAVLISDGHGGTVPAVGRRVINVMAHGAAGDGVTDDTAAFAAAREQQTAERGGEIFLPVGDYSVSHIDATGSVPFVMRGESMSGSVVTARPKAGVVLALGGSASVEESRLSNFSIVGHHDSLGGISLGSVEHYTALTQMESVRVTGFSGEGAFGISLVSVQELDVLNCFVSDNYNNFYRPPEGFCTSTVIRGFAGYCGRATHRGVQIDGYCCDLMVREVVLESNAGAAVYAVDSSGFFLLVDCYFEGNNLTGGDPATLVFSGSASDPRRCRVVLDRGRWGANDVSPALYLDRATRSLVTANDKMDRLGIITTAETQCHFSDNSSIGTVDIAALYAALLGKISADDIGADGNRFSIP